MTKRKGYIHCILCGNKLPKLHKKYCSTVCQKEGGRLNSARYYKKHPKRIRNCRIKRLYGITLNDVKTIFNNQRGKCALCGKEIYFNVFRSFHIDHCHETGKIRGLLCKHCNTSLGQLGDNVSSIKKVLQYVSFTYNIGIIKEDKRK